MKTKGSRKYNASALLKKQGRWVAGVRGAEKNFCISIRTIRTKIEIFLTFKNPLRISITGRLIYRKIDVKVLTKSILSSVPRRCFFCVQPIDIFNDQVFVNIERRWLLCYHYHEKGCLSVLENIEKHWFSNLFHKGETWAWKICRFY